jgi:hypothetical protein
MYLRAQTATYPMWNSMVDGGFAFPLVNTLGFREGRYLCVGLILLFFYCYLVISQPFFFLSSLHHLTIVMAVFCLFRREGDSWVLVVDSQLGTTCGKRRYTPRGETERKQQLRERLGRGGGMNMGR